MAILYVDVSHHDWDRRGGQLDWAAVKAATSPVMCARATYGDPAGYHPTSRHFGDFQTAAAAAGFVLRGGYHNLIRGDAGSMGRQVDWFRSELDRYGCQWAMVDVERYVELVVNDLWPRWADVLRFRDAWSAVEGRPLVYYLPQWLVRDYYGDVDLDELAGPLVQSHYAGGDGTAAQIYAAAGGDQGTGWDDLYGGRTADIWQFTSAANVAGASDGTDVNAYRGTLAQITALFTGSDDMTPSQQYIQHVGNYRIDSICQLRLATVVPAFTASDGTKFAGFTEPNKLSQWAAAQTASDEDIEALVRQAIQAASDDPAMPEVVLTPQQIEQMTAGVVAGVKVVIPTAEQNADAVLDGESARLAS
jgi:GH25 family lysozyme M1 (1,4-beta-N-acetylmuramidase)